MIQKKPQSVLNACSRSHDCVCEREESPNSDLTGTNEVAEHLGGGSVCVGITPCSPTDIADLVQPANIEPAFSLLDASQGSRSYHKQDVTLLTLPKYTVNT